VSAAAPVTTEADERLVPLEVRRDGVAVLVLDAVLGAHHTITPAFGAQLAAAIDRVEHDASIAAAVLVYGNQGGFLAGPELETLKAIKFATDAERLASEAASGLRRIEMLRKPVVAAVHGPILGGPFELALACHAIVASDDPATQLGLPDVRLGLLAPANGLPRLARRAGLRTSMGLALAGRVVRAETARAQRLVDEVCPRAILVEVAARRAKSLVGRVPRVPDERVDVASLALEKNPLGRALLFRRTREREHTRAGPHYPAPQRILDVLERYSSRGFDAAAELEAKAFGELVVSETAHRLIELFFATAALERDAGVDESAVPRAVSQVAVLGGGEVASGVAFATAHAGIAVRIHEKDDAATGRVVRAVHALLDQGVASGAMVPLERERVLTRLSSSADLSGLRLADLVVETLEDDLTLKQARLRQVEPRIGADCVYASHTPSIPIAKIAQVATVPGRVLGMRYSTPASEMQLLEVVRADKTEGWAVATAVALGKQQGKTVIVVKDAPGFYTTRVLAPLIHEALHLASEGVPVEAVDGALVEWGFPEGPLELLDGTGIDVAARHAHMLHAAFGERMTPPGALTKLVADERRGRSSGRGIYREPTTRLHARGLRRGPTVVVDPEVYALLGTPPTLRLPVEEIQMRCALALVNEAVRCLGEGVLRRASDGDVGAVFGLGFPAFRGGPFRYVDTLGAAETLRRVQAYADRFGERWRPAPLLVQMARRGEAFYA
jgi:3-hydroxyacyl-CoA dehydrogenase/enoyl-CoA hydratase/3-hydroxybutyryl-CoA epimerase